MTAPTARATPGGRDEIALAAEDRAILDLECATVVGHTAKIVVLGPAAGNGAAAGGGPDAADAPDTADPPDAAAIRGRIGARLAAAPELRYRLAGTPERPVWTPTEVDLAVHVVDRAGPPADAAALRGIVAEIFSRHLDRARPLWAIDVVPLVDGGTALVWRLHHALADGSTGERLARAVLWDEEPGDEEPGDEAPGDATPAPAPRGAVTPAQDHARRRAHLAGFLRREFAPGTCRSPFDGTVGTRREVAFLDTAFPPLHDAARAHGATVNDAVLSLVAGAVRRRLEQRGARISDLRVRVPVSLHQQDADALNRDSWFTVPLPLHLVDPVARLRAVHRLTTARKDGDDAVRMDGLLRDHPGGTPAFRRWMERVQAGPRGFAVSVSNVIGPRAAVRVLGAPVRSVRPLAEIGRRHALRIGTMSAGDVLAFGICADPTIVEDVGALADGLEQEIDLLLRAPGRRGS